LLPYLQCPTVMYILMMLSPNLKGQLGLHFLKVLVFVKLVGNSV
jgi:hypothetical protein